MERLIETPQQASNGKGESLKGSPSNDPDDGDEFLMRMQLAAIGRGLPTTVTTAEVSAAFARWRSDQEKMLEANRLARQLEIESRAAASAINRDRDTLSRNRIDATNMADDEVAIEANRLRQEESSRREEAAAMQAEEARRRVARKLIAQSESPARALEDLSAAEASDNPEWHRIRDLLVAQAEYASGYLVSLLGTSGVGKTVLAVSVVEKCCWLGMTCRYVKAIDLFRNLRSAYTQAGRGERGVSEEDLVEQWAKADVLVIDELHQRGGTDAEHNSLTNLLDRRYDDRRCTILVANQDRKEFAANVGDSVVSRIQQTGEAFDCKWASYRKSGYWKAAEGSAKRKPSGLPKTSIVYG